MRRRIGSIIVVLVATLFISALAIAQGQGGGLPALQAQLDAYDHPWTQFGTDVYYEDGNVGIGDSSPDGKLEVNPDETEDNGDEFVVDSTGNVGIGTTSPASKLHVSATGNPDIKVTSTGAGFSPSLTFATISDRWRMMRKGSGGFAIEDLGADGGSGDRLFIDNDGDIFMAHNGGNVGIGTMNPGAKLHVFGSIRVDGDEGGENNTITFTDETQDGSPVGIGTTMVGVAHPITQVSSTIVAKWLKVYVGTEVYYMPLFQ